MSQAHASLECSIKVVLPFWKAAWQLTPAVGPPAYLFWNTILCIKNCIKYSVFLIHRILLQIKAFPQIRNLDGGF